MGGKKGGFYFFPLSDRGRSEAPVCDTQACSATSSALYTGDRMPFLRYPPRCFAFWQKEEKTISAEVPPPSSPLPTAPLLLLLSWSNKMQGCQQRSVTANIRAPTRIQLSLPPSPESFIHYLINAFTVLSERLYISSKMKDKQAQFISPRLDIDHRSRRASDSFPEKLMLDASRCFHFFFLLLLH